MKGLRAPSGACTYNILTERRKGFQVNSDKAKGVVMSVVKMWTKGTTLPDIICSDKRPRAPNGMQIFLMRAEQGAIRA